MTLIEWSDKTWNPTVGCARCSPGCDSCYAITVAQREMQPAHVGLTHRVPVTPRYNERAGRIDWTGEVRLLPERLVTPLRWRKDYKVFVDSMSDLFEPSVPEDYIDEVFAVMGATKGLHRSHAFQILTKRPHRMASYINAPDRYERVVAAANRLAHDDRIGELMYPGLNWLRYAFDAWPLPNVWLGTSVEDQQRARLRVPQLLKIDGWLLWLSIEPMIGPVDLEDEWMRRLQWIVVGGESGARARPMHPEWARLIRDQCMAHDVPLLFKQWGQYAPAQSGTVHARTDKRTLLVDLDGHSRPAADALPAPGAVAMFKLRSKHDVGRELDGKVWDEYPR